MSNDMRHTNGVAVTAQSEALALHSEAAAAASLQIYLWSQVANRSMPGAVLLAKAIAATAMVYWLSKRVKGFQPPTAGPSVWVAKDSSGCPMALRAFKGNKTIMENAMSLHKCIKPTALDPRKTLEFRSVLSKGLLDQTSFRIVRDFLRPGISYMHDLLPQWQLEKLIPRVPSVFEHIMTRTAMNMSVDDYDRYLERCFFKFIGNVYNAAISGFHKNPLVVETFNLNRDLLTASQLQHPLGILGAYAEMWAPLLPEKYIAHFKNYLGAVHYTLDSGAGKVRWFCSPNSWVMTSLRPVQRKLLDELRRLPRDYTHDQDAGRRFVQSRLRTGNTAWCYDLTSATDVFPLRVILEVMARLPRQVLDLFKYVSQADYLLAADGQPVAWNTGNPLGTPPSFMMFARAHHAVALSSVIAAGGDPLMDYCIVGDDIVIFNQQAAVNYEWIMGKLEVELNPAKSSVSDQYARFLGAVVPKKGKIVNPGTWTTLTAANAATKIQQGYDYSQLLPHGFASHVKALERIPFPVGLARLTDAKLRSFTIEEATEAWSYAIRPFSLDEFWFRPGELEYQILSDVTFDSVPLSEFVLQKESAFTIPTWWEQIQDTYNAIAPPVQEFDQVDFELIFKSGPTHEICYEGSLAISALHYILRVVLVDRPPVATILTAYTGLRKLVIQEFGTPLVSLHEIASLILTKFPYMTQASLFNHELCSIWKKLRQVVTGKDVLVSPMALDRLGMKLKFMHRPH